jgi:iron(III) transport system ATP-binding protein
MVKITDLVRVFPAGRGSIVACDRISVEIPQGRFFTLLGPSGCGKTTTLRCIAGLERPDGGEITLDQVTVYSSRQGLFVPPNQRSIGMVFQSYAIWPHMTVFDNVAFPLRVGRQRRPEAEVTRRVRSALETVRLAGLETRSATSLSGGQQQRLALARALVREPQVLLLDEPLSNLDAKLREQMRLELRALQRQLGITTIYVTHDQIEALAMSNIVAVMHNGRIVQVGPPREIYERPQSPFVADFIGLTNLIPGRVKMALGDDRYRVETDHGAIVATVAGQADPRAEVLVSIRPEDVLIHTTQPADTSATWEATVDQVVFLGELVDCRLAVDGLLLRAHAHPSIRVRRGDRVFLEFNPERCIAIRPEGDAPAARE